jgi:Flp pilus assembly protein TadG
MRNVVGHTMRKLFRNDRGAAIIELALVAPVLALMTIGIVDISNAYNRKLVLEQGAQRAIEKIMQTTQDSTVDDTLKSEAVCQVDGTNADGSCKSTPITTDNVSVTHRTECIDADGTVHVQADPNTDCLGTQKTRTYISVTVTDTYTPMFPIHFAAFNTGDGSYHLSATAGMRTQ